MRLEAAFAITFILLASSFAPLGGADTHRPLDAPCEGSTADVTVETLVFTGNGEDVHACYAYPASGKAGVTNLVVVAHGLGWTVQAGWTGHMVELVERVPGTAVIATNYRDNFGFPVLRGAEDLILATEAIEADLAAAGATVETTVLLGVSMGAAVSGTAIHQASTGLYDYWFDVEGVTNLLETYAEASAVAPGIPFAADVVAGIERDAGDKKPWEDPDGYRLRTVVLNAAAMKAAGLQGAVVVHGVNDGLVPYDQAREMAAAFVAAGVPVEVNTAVRGEAGHTGGTTPTAHALPPAQDPNEQFLHLAGHASEGDGGHIVMHTAMERLVDFLTDRHLDQVAENVHDAGPGL